MDFDSPLRTAKKSELSPPPQGCGDSLKNEINSPHKKRRKNVKIPKQRSLFPHFFFVGVCVPGKKVAKNKIMCHKRRARLIKKEEKERKIRRPDKLPTPGRWGGGRRRIMENWRKINKIKKPGEKKEKNYAGRVSPESTPRGDTHLGSCQMQQPADGSRVEEPP